LQAKFGSVVAGLNLHVMTPVKVIENDAVTGNGRQGFTSGQHADLLATFYQTGGEGAADGTGTGDADA
jgi:hypothetical protein